jgi:ankyrin repeat protein
MRGSMKHRSLLSLLLSHRCLWFASTAHSLANPTRHNASPSTAPQRVHKHSNTHAADTQIHAIARYGNGLLVNYYLYSTGANNNSVLEKREPHTQWTPLHTAMRYHNEPAVRALLAWGANIRARGLFVERLPSGVGINQTDCCAAAASPSQVLESSLINETGSALYPVAFYYTPLHLAVSINSTVLAALLM